MKKIVTITGLVCLFAGLSILTTATAQDRDDIIWARDIGGEEIVVDGEAEAVWSMADSFQVSWGTRAGLPGSGWRFHQTAGIVPALADPTDPVEANVKVLRKGNQLYLMAAVQDSSIGGSTGLWNIDALVMQIMNRAGYTTQAEAGGNGDGNMFPLSDGNGEFIIGWWHEADTTAEGVPTPGSLPRIHNGGILGLGTPNNDISKERTQEQIDVLEVATVVDGIANDDTHGTDGGYTVEMRLDLSVLGYDGDQEGGDFVPWSFTVYDTDWQWPLDFDRTMTTKVWWQNQWGNNFNEGAARIMMHPDVNVGTAVLPDVLPDFSIRSGELFDAPVLDGSLDDEIWTKTDELIQIQYQGAEKHANLPGLGPQGVFWFRPDINGDGRAATVVDPTTAGIKFFHRDGFVYIGVNTDDQAISGALAEGGRDGIRFSINRLDSLDGDNTLFVTQLDFSVDSTGTLQVGGDIANLLEASPGSIEAAASLNGASTVADPTDVDEGYQIEIKIDLAALGYEEDLPTPWFWFGANFFDGDFFEDPVNNYAMRTWLYRERTTGPGMFAYLDTSADNAIGVGVEDEGILPESVALRGNYPNPFNPVTTLQYALPSAGEVTLRVFDVLGRQVATLAQGVQAAGSHELRFDGANLASGLYLYRVELTEGASGDLQMSGVGRMLLIK